MNGFRASLAIIRRSLDRRFATTWLLWFASAFSLAALAGARLPAIAWLAFLIVAEAPAAAFDGRNDPRRRVSFFAMPLYGRQLARALAVAPCLESLAAPLAVIAGLALAGRPLGGAGALTVSVAAVAATLVALSARLRTGREAALYVALALAAETSIVAPRFLAPAGSLTLSLALAGLIAFCALRAFGETLARYDPIPAA